MTQGHHVLERHLLPISAVRADGQPEAPPAGLIRDVELAFGPRTPGPSVDPIGMEGVEWPKPCVWRDEISWRGVMLNVEHIGGPLTQADKGNTELNGFSVIFRDVTFHEMSPAQNGAVPFFCDKCGCPVTVAYDAQPEWEVENVWHCP